MIKNSTKLQKERQNEGLDTHADSVCDSVITFYPEWNGKLSDLNEWSTNQGGTAFQKSNDNTLTAKQKQKHKQTRASAGFSPNLIKERLTVHLGCLGLA